MGKHKKSKYVGVYFDKRQCCWYAAIVDNAKRNQIGYKTRVGTGYPNTEEGEKEAAKAYDKSAIKFGLPTNFLKKVEHKFSPILCTCKWPEWIHAQYEHDDNKCGNCNKRIRQ